MIGLPKIHAYGRELPRWPYRLNRDSDLAQGLRNLWAIGPGVSFDFVTGQQDGTPTGATSTIGHSRYGRTETVYSSVNDSDYLACNPELFTSGQQSFSFATLCRPEDNASGWEGIMLARTTAPTGIHYSGTSGSVTSILGGGSYGSGSFVSCPTNAWHLVVAEFHNVATSNWTLPRHVVDDGGRTSTYDGTSTSSGVIPLGSLRLGMDSYSSTRTARGDYVWAGIWGEDLGDDRIERLWWDNDLFEPLPSRVYFLPEAAGGAFKSAWAANSTVTIGAEAA